MMLSCVARLLNMVTSERPRYFGVNELRFTGLSPWTWRRWAYDGKIASIKAGKRLLIPGSEVDRVLREGLRPALGAEGR